MAAFAAIMGVTLKPWQRHVVDVATELVDHPVHGPIHAYNTISLSVGRRAGKTLLVFLMAIRQMLAKHRQEVWFTAQDRASAALHLRNEYLPLLEDSRLREAAKVMLGNGNEAIGFPTTQSWLRLFAPGPKALHGMNSDLVVIDECFAFDTERGQDLEVAVRPTTYTRPGAQIILTSAAGDLSSTYWGTVLEQGRAAAELDTGRGHAHFEWTLDGTDLDPDDPDTWDLVHPGGLDREILEAEYRKDREQFIRTVLNVTDRTGSAGSPIDLTQWRKLAGEHGPRDRITLGVDVSPDQATAAIVAAYNGTIEVIDFRPGIHWVPDRIVGLVDSWPVEMVALDAAGPVGPLVPVLERHGVPLVKYALRDVTAAAAGFVEATRCGIIRHVVDVALDAAVEGARRRNVGDGAWSVSRTNSIHDASPLIAATFAWHAHPDTHGQAATGIY